MSQLLLQLGYAINVFATSSGVIKIILNDTSDDLAVKSTNAYAASLRVKLDPLGECGFKINIAQNEQRITSSGLRSDFVDGFSRICTLCVELDPDQSLVGAAQTEKGPKRVN